MLVLWGKGAVRNVRLICVWALAIAVLACGLGAGFALAAPQGGVNGATWQDNNRNHRRSPNQIVTQLRTSPQAQAGQMPLEDSAQAQRAAKTQAQIAAGEAPLPQNGQLDLLGPGDWRIKILAAAVTNTDMVLLGDIAQPLGQMDQNIWSRLREQKLWPAPPEEGKPLQINRTRLAQALRQALGKEVAGRCILPGSLVIQKGGLVFREDDLRSYVVKSLTPQLSAMPGEVELSDFRLPDYIFLAHAQQRVQLEPGKLTPGRVPLRFAVQEADGTVLRRISGTVNLTLWITAPAASRPMIESRRQLDRAIDLSVYPGQDTWRAAGETAPEYRGVGFCRANVFGKNFDAYRAERAPEIFLVAQIEHIRAVDDLDAILAHPRLDAIMCRAVSSLRKMFGSGPTASSRPTCASGAGPWWARGRWSRAMWPRSASWAASPQNLSAC